MDARTHCRGRRAVLLALAAATLAWPGLGAAADAPISEQLTISGAVRTPSTWTVAALAALPADQTASVTVSRKGEDPASTSSVRGVRLTTLLDRAGLVEADHNTWKHTIVLATATDGYQVVFSWPELFDTEVGPGVLVIFERDGRPLDDHDGRIALVSAKDTRPGPRNVHWLSRVEVRILAE